LNREFTAYGETLEIVTSFKYLGHPLSATDNDRLAVGLNLRKGRQRWARVSTVLRAEGLPPKAGAMFYKAIVQSVLLYGVETWVLTASMRKTLAGFHHRVGQSLSGLRPFRRLNETWEYPPVADALEACGLRTMDEYIARRREYLKSYVINRPVYSLCVNSSRLPGTPTRTRFWWEVQDETGDEEGGSDVE
jgi:hypothetical protein